MDARGLAARGPPADGAFRHRLADEEELDEIVRRTFQEAQQRSLQPIESKLTQSELEVLVQTLRGLTTEEAARVVSGAIYNDNVLDRSDLPRVVDAKRTLLGTAGCLEVNRRRRFAGRDRRAGQPQAVAEPAARRFYGQRPGNSASTRRGGCCCWACKGAARASARRWSPRRGGCRCCGMDPGVLYQKYIGESEARLREALRQAESMAPVVLWIDEIEKAFASAGSDSADGGLSQRMFGTLLSWMQDHRQPIFSDRHGQQPRPAAAGVDAEGPI